MNIPFIVTLVGEDRPGLVNALAECAAANGANWLDSSMAHLTGKFAGIVRLDVAAADADRLEAALRALSSTGLSLSIERMDSACESASFSGEAMFRAEIEVRVPASVPPAELQAALESLANELMVDLKLEAGA